MRNSIQKLVGWPAITTAALFMGTILWATDKGPDGGNYTVTDSVVYSFIDPFGGGGSPSVLGATDSGVAPLTLPFTFTFYGKLYNSVCVSSSGVLYLVADANACTAQLSLVDFANTDLTSTKPPNNLPVIAPFWADLSMSNGAVYYQTNGSTVGSRQFVIEWYNALPASSQNPVTFEAILFEGSNNVMFQYQTVDLGSGNRASKGALATVGISDTADLNVNNARTDTRQLQWSYDAAVLANSSAILYHAPSATATSVNTINTSPAGLNVTIDGVDTQTPTVVSWVPGTDHTLAVTASLTTGGVKTDFTSWNTSPTQTTALIHVTAQPAGTTYTASFATQYHLTLTSNDSNQGTVSATPASPGLDGFYPAGQVVSVQAAATSSYAFKNFTGALTGTTNPQNLTMDGAKNVTAVFEASFSPCDVDHLNGITSADIPYIVNEVLHNGITHDINKDNAVNVVDIQIVINAVINSTCASQ